QVFIKYIAFFATKAEAEAFDGTKAASEPETSEPEASEPEASEPEASETENSQAGGNEGGSPTPTQATLL
ncbi:MAG: hypothetical protein J5874_02910, partial [Oscillospiraceae bacterium]|nr:hypothetical protein [Oscillospiraceae bacterium]